MRDGNWPTALNTKAAKRMAAYIGPRLETQIKPAIAEVAKREHKWGLYAFLVVIASLGVVFFAYNLWKPIGHLALALAAIVNFKTMKIYREKAKALSDAKSALDGIVSAELFALDYADIDFHSEDNPLPIFDAAGFFNLYDEVHHLQSYGPMNESGHPTPLMSHARMTRTEVEHYTDSKGKRQTRTRIVQVFHGTMLTLDVPGPIDDSRILISSRRHARPRGVFERTSFVAGKRHEIKLKPIKVSSPRFSKLFKIEGDDQMESHNFLDPDRVMRFLNLVDDLSDMFGGGGEKLSVLITRGRAYIAIETGPLANVTGFTGTAAQMENQIETLAAQLALPHIIAEHLKLTVPPRYEWDNDITNAPEESLA